MPSSYYPDQPIFPHAASFVALIHLRGLQVAWLEREATNPKDRNALLIMAAPPGGVLGYLPRRVAQHLSDMVERKLILSKATVTQLPVKSTSPVDIYLDVCPAATL